MGTALLTERAKYRLAIAIGSVFIFALTGGSIFIAVRILGVPFLNAPVIAGTVTRIHLGIPVIIFILVFGMGLIHHWLGYDGTSKYIRKEIRAFRQIYGMQFTPTRHTLKKYVFVYVLILGLYSLVLCNIVVYSIDFESSAGRVLSIGAAWLMIPVWVIAVLVLWSRKEIRRLERKVSAFIEYVNAHTPETNLCFDRDIGVKKVGLRPAMGSSFQLYNLYRGKDIHYKIESAHEARVPIAYYSSPGRRFNLVSSYATTVEIKGLSRIKDFQVFITQRNGRKALDFEEGELPDRVKRSLLKLSPYCYVEASAGSLTLFSASKERFPAYSLEGVILLIETLADVAGQLNTAL